MKIPFLIKYIFNYLINQKQKSKNHFFFVTLFSFFKGCFRDIYQALLYHSILQRKFCESLAQMHIFLKLLKDLLMKMIGMRKQSIQSSHDRV